MVTEFLNVILKIMTVLLGLGDFDDGANDHFGWYAEAWVARKRHGNAKH
jgi:hypothetical protein